MARYDVFLASTLADREKADLIVRRLRALKFKVRQDKKREHTTPTPRDYRDADNSQSVLILWSKTACDTDQADSDWIHAIAHHARSKPGTLLQAGLDGSVPDEPFSEDNRFSLTGMGPRKLVEGYYELVDELGRRDGRKDLRDWLSLKTSDKAGKDAWKEDHPTDPLSQAPKSKASAAPKPAPTSVKPSETSEAVVIPPIASRELNPPSGPTESDDIIERLMLGAVTLLIAGMLLMSGLMRSGPAGASNNAIGNATLAAQCEPGEIPAYLLDRQNAPLEPGPIIDDTE